MPTPTASAVLTTTALRAAALLGLKNADLTAMLGASGVTISRCKNGTSWIDPASEAGQRALLLVRIFQCLTSLTGADDELRRAWMRSRNETLGGAPAALMLQPGGLMRTLAYLESMAPGGELTPRPYRPVQCT